MKNKVLINLSMPELDAQYDLFIPVNDYVWKIKKLILKSISDLNGGIVNINQSYLLINVSTGTIYTDNEIIINTDIRNASRLILTEYKN